MPPPRAAVSMVPPMGSTRPLTAVGGIDCIPVRACCRCVQCFIDEADVELSQAWPCMSLQMSPRSAIERVPELKGDLRFSSKGVMVLHTLHGWRSTVNTLREQKDGRMAGQLAEDSSP